VPSGDASAAAGRCNRERVYEFIRAYMAEHGWPPSMEEIAEGTGLRSKATAHKHVSELVAEGRLRRGSRRYALQLAPAEREA